MDALQMGIMKLGVDLHFTTYHRDGKLFWEEGREGYGLIVPKAARDLLKGVPMTLELEQADASEEMCGLRETPLRSHPAG